MVDINLFDESEEEEKGQGDQSFDNMDDSGGLSLEEDKGDTLESDDAGDLGGGLDDSLGVDDLGGESLDDALGFEEDLSNSNELGGDFLGEDDGLSDLDEDELTGNNEDYDFGSGKTKKISPLFLVFVFIAALFIVLILVVTSNEGIRKRVMGIVPGLNKSSRVVNLKKPSAQTPRRVKSPTQTKVKSPAQTQVKTDSASVKPTTRRTVSRQGGSVINTSVNILKDLSAQGQFGAAIIEKDRFRVEYASAEKGKAEEFGKKLQILAGASSFISSPEDMHTSNGKTVYLGVISGKIDSVKTSSVTGTPFKNENEFIGLIKSNIKEQGLVELGIKKHSSRTVAGRQNLSYEIMLEGEKSKAEPFLQKLKILPGAWEPSKIRIFPADIDDYHAKKVKIVMDATVLVDFPAGKPAM